MKSLSEISVVNLLELLVITGIVSEVGEFTVTYISM